MHIKIRRSATAPLSLALILVLAFTALAQRLVTVPAGTIVPLRMDTYLSSDNSHVGDRFTATVFRPVVIDSRVVIPEGAKVEGHVTSTTRAERGSKAGTVAIAFDRIVIQDGPSIPVDGSLTTLSEEARRQIEGEVSEEDRVEGGSRTRRAVVFIGGGAGAGAVIGAVTGGAKGAAVGAGVGAVLGTIGVLLSKGDKAEVQPGTEFGMMVERSFTVNTEGFGVASARDVNETGVGATSQGDLTSSDTIRSAQTILRNRGYYNGPVDGVVNPAMRTAIRNFQRDRSLTVTGNLDYDTASALGITTTDSGSSGGGPSQTVFTSSESIRFAQISLRDRGYYNGPINGVLTPGTRAALRRFQGDRNLSLSGDLDVATARELGIASESGGESFAIEITNPRAERIDRDSIRISADVQTRGSGWNVFINRFVSGNTLHVYVRGVPPRNATGTATDHHPFTETYNGLASITRVIFHGPQRDFTIDPLTTGGVGGGVGSGSTGGAGAGNGQQIAFIANRLLQSFQRDLNVRSLRGQVVFDNRRDLKNNEVQLLFQINSVKAAAELYNQLTSTVTDPEAVRGAADALRRQSRLLDRMIKRYNQMTLSSIVKNDLDQLQAEIARISGGDGADDDLFR
jgi:peptidoglycan hydrolase-like protein with peptidoglycan-binding domain